jgi:hypothetical protein
MADRQSNTEPKTGGIVAVRLPTRAVGGTAGHSSSRPDGANVSTAPVPRHIDNALVKAIARAFRWRKMLENGMHATIAEI